MLLRCDRLEDVLQPEGLGEGKHGAAPEHLSAAPRSRPRVPRFEHRDPLPEQHGLVGIVGDVEHWECELVPHPEQVGEDAERRGRSSAARGSSSSRARGPEAMARASATRCRSPPESSSTPRSCRESADLEHLDRPLERVGPREAPLRPRPKRIFPSTSRWGKRVGSWGTQPSRRSSGRQIDLRAPALASQVPVEAKCCAGLGDEAESGLEQGRLSRAAGAEEDHHALVPRELDVEGEARSSAAATASW